MTPAIGTPLSTKLRTWLAVEVPRGAQPWLFLETQHHKRAFALLHATPTELLLAAKTVIS